VATRPRSPGSLLPLTDSLMKLAVILSSVALTISGFLFVNALLSEEPWEAMGTEVAAEVDVADDRPDLSLIVERLDRISARLDLLENAPAAPARLPAGDLVERAELDALREEMQAMAAGKGASKAAVSELLKQDVAAALEEVRAAEQTARADAKRVAAQAKLDSQMPEYQRQLGLTSAQTEGLRGVIEAREERVAEMMRLWQSGDRAAASEMKSNEAETYQTELQGVLNQQQVEQFNAMGGGRRGGK